MRLEHQPEYRHSDKIRGQGNQNQRNKVEPDAALDHFADGDITRAEGNRVWRGGHGIIKAHVAASATGMVRSRTLISPVAVRPIPTETPPIIGRKVAAVAVLDVNSVRTSTKAATAPMSKKIGRLPSPLATSPIHRDKPDAVNIADSDKPPPKSSRTSHGSSFAVFQSSRRTPVLRSAGRMNINKPAVIPTMASS